MPGPCHMAGPSYVELSTWACIPDAGRHIATQTVDAKVDSGVPHARKGFCAFPWCASRQAREDCTRDGCRRNHLCDQARGTFHSSLSQAPGIHRTMDWAQNRQRVAWPTSAITITADNVCYVRLVMKPEPQFIIHGPISSAPRRLQPLPMPRCHDPAVTFR